MRLLFLAFVLALLPSMAHAANVDISLDQGGISFSPSTFYEGDTVRIYARIRNLGDTDVTAVVYFYEGSTVLGSEQVVSLRAEGAPEEVFVDFIVPEGTFNVRVVLRGTDPEDTNLSNNEATTPLYSAIADDDRDGVLNDVDLCPENADAAQKDTDNDGIGDVCDPKDDTPVVLPTPVVSVQEEETQEEETIETPPPIVPARPVVQPTVATKVAVAPSEAAATSAVGQSSSDVVLEEAGNAQGVARPTSSYGIFPAIAVVDGEAAEEHVSFFRADNPWLYALIAVLAIAMISALATIAYLRFRALPESDDERSV